MNASKLTSVLCSGLLALGMTTTAQAYEKGDLVLRLGHITAEHNEHSNNFDGPLAATNTKVVADNDSGLGLNLMYMLSDNLGLELLAATPFRHDISSQGGVAINLGHVKHLPPTLSLLYFPMAKDSKFQPYIGGGINYTWIYGEDLSSTAKGAGLSNLEVRNSWGWAGRAGFDYMLDERWSVGAGVWYLDINTKATAKLNGTRTTANLELDPTVYMFGLGYTF